MEFRQKKILIVDDNPTFIMYVAILLKRMGFTVIPSNSAEEAKKLLKMTEPDLIMLDVRMPNMDGIDLLQNIKNDKQTSHIPVVMVSVDANKETIEKCKGLGCPEYLIKPFKIDKLHEVLQQCIFSKLGQGRKCIRAPFTKMVKVVFKGNSYKLYSESISEIGIYLRTKDPFPVGSKLKITVPLKAHKTIRLQGIVVYIKGIFGDVFRIPPGMAVEFTSINRNNAKKIKDSVTEILAGDILEAQEEVVIEKGD
ncbi:MAG: response regulator [Nitrospirota bacterium]